MNLDTQNTATSDYSNQGFWAVLWSARTRIALLGIACGSAAAAFAFTAPEEWEASGIVKLAKVSEVRGPGVIERVWVEAPPLSAERLAMSSFQNSVLQSIGRSEGETSDEADLYRRSLRGRVVAPAEIIQVKVRARSPETAEQLLEATVRKLSEIHEQLVAPNVQGSREQLAVAKRRTGELDREKARLYELLARAGGDKSQVATAIYALDSERREIEKRQSLLEDQLRSDRLAPTALVGPGYAPKQRAFPRRGLIILTGLIVGLAIGAGRALGRRA